MTQLIKKYLIFFYLISFFTFPAYSGERYDDVKKKINSSDLSVFVDGFREIIISYDLEGNFVKDCLISLKVKKKLPTNECSKVLNRAKGIANLTSIIESSNFKNNLLRIASNIDAKKSKITMQDLEKLTKDFQQKFNRFNSLTKEVNFVISKL